MNKKPDLSLFADLKDKDLKNSGICIGEGGFVIRRMMEAGLEILTVLGTEDQIAKLPELSSRIAPMVIMTKEEISRVAGFNFHRGIIAAASRPEMPDLSSLLALSPSPPMIVVLPHTSEADNVGAIMRSAAAFGIDHIVLGDKCADPFSRKAIRASMAACFTRTVSVIRDEEEAASLLRKAGYGIVTMEVCPSRGRRFPAWNYPFPEKCALVAGHEAEGVNETWRNASEKALFIPIETAVDSLNVSVASGIVFYEYYRRKGLKASASTIGLDGDGG